MHNNGVTKPWVNGVKSDKIGVFQWRKSGKEKSLQVINLQAFKWGVDDRRFELLTSTV